MPEDLQSTDLVLLSRLARNLPSKPSPATIWRWHARGVNGVKLKVIRIGGRLFTKQTYWDAFVAAQNPPLAGTEAAGQRSEATAERLREAGLMNESTGEAPSP